MQKRLDVLGGYLYYPPPRGVSQAVRPPPLLDNPWYLSARPHPRQHQAVHPGGLEAGGWVDPRRYHGVVEEKIIERVL